MNRESKYRLGFVAAVLVRMVTLVSPVIDDDEAWFSVIGYPMRSASDVFHAAVDNKPPAMAWYYWAISRLTGPAHLAQWARAVEALLAILPAVLLAGLAVRRKSRQTFWEIALIAYLAIGAFGPKIFAVTDEGLMVPLVVAALYLVWPETRVEQEASPRRLAAAFVSGAVLAVAFLFKQTGVVLLLPWALACANLAVLGAGAAGMAVILGGSVLVAGPTAFWEWTWVYPSTVLREARDQLFSAGSDGALLFGLFGLTLLPLATLVPRAIALPLHSRAQRVLIAWFATSIVAIAAGKGLFPHYFLLLVPPMILMASQFLAESPWTWRWLAIPFAASALVAATPSLAVFWGNDLPYFTRLADRIAALGPESEPVFYWGGSPVPLALSARMPLRGFPTARFAAPPYASASSRELFLERLAETPPGLVVDVHERGDNQFNLPVTAVRELARVLERDYTLWSDPALPWARFYIRKDRASRVAGLCPGKPALAPGVTPYPQSIASLSENLRRISGESMARVLDAANSLSSLNPVLRARFAAEWAASACRAWSKARGAPSDAFALDARFWWASLAVTELQPVMVERRRQP